MLETAWPLITGLLVYTVIMWIVPDMWFHYILGATLILIVTGSIYMTLILLAMESASPSIDDLLMNPYPEYLHRYPLGW